MTSIVNKSLFHRSALLLPALLTVLGMASSCNSKSDPDEEQIAVTISTTAVKDFSLKANANILANLDSVFFSIDLNRGVIFNADSLPKGTDITRMVPVITFTTTMSKADIVVSEPDGTTIKTVNYLETTTDSIDFTKNVALNVTAYDGETNYTYRIKVNVHEQVPDSMMWDREAVAKLAARLSSPRLQRSVEFKDKVYSLVKENDGSLTLATSSDLYKGVWSKKETTLPFTPDLRSFTATTTALYILDEGGTLYTSTDAENWTSTGEQWVSVIGAYMDSLLGIRSDNGLMHCHYPASASIADAPVAADFPVSGRSDFHTVETKWATEPYGFFVGGTLADGSLSSATWAFDGSVWTTIDNLAAPAVTGASVVKYVAWRNTGSLFHQIEFETWMLIGGKLADGSMNRHIYLSPDNGVTWKETDSLMDMPDYLPGLYSADAIVQEKPLNASLTDYWTDLPARKPGRWLTRSYTLDGYEITWDCPYIYLIGGITADGSLSDTIWRGVLTRLEFTPLI